MGIQINDFLYAFSREARFCLSLPVFWTVTIDGVTTSAINSVLSKADEKWRARISPLDMIRRGSLLVAQEVQLPNESSSFTPTSMNNYGGFLPGYGLDARSDFLSRSLSINILETDDDLEHEYFRPWMIAVGIKGLVETGSPLKGTIEINQYTNDGFFKKGFRFNKAFPTAVEGFNLNYENTDYKIKSVTFACQNYEQL
jgi:hypothetical protein